MCDCDRGVSWASLAADYVVWGMKFVEGIRGGTEEGGFMTGRPRPRDVISRFGDWVCNCSSPFSFGYFPYGCLLVLGGWEYTGLVSTLSPFFLVSPKGEFGDGIHVSSGGIYHISPWPGYQILRLEEGGSGVGVQKGPSGNGVSEGPRPEFWESFWQSLLALSRLDKIGHAGC